MKNALIITTIIVFAFIGYFLFACIQKDKVFSSSALIENTPTSSILNTNEPIITKNEIEYTDNGFSPTEIKIKIGHSITFVNKSSNPMWVASDDHPTHMIYPEFDSKKAYSSEEIYTFTFEKVGSWNYHNHLRPNDKARVIVEE